MKMEEKGINTPVIVGIIVTVVVVTVVGAVAAVVLLKPGEGPAPGGPTTTPTTTPGGEETHELFYDYQVGEYYNYETAGTTTSIQDNTETETSQTSAYSMQITAVEGNEITTKTIGTETIANENVDVTLVMTMSNRGEIISWEIENVVPLEYLEAAEAYENTSMAFSELFGLEFPEEAIPIGHEWGSPTEAEYSMGPYIVPITGERSAHFVGEESITVEAGTFDCWRFDYTASASGERTVDNHVLTMSLTCGGTGWLGKQNCAQIKSTMSYTMNFEYDGYTGRYLGEAVTELVEYGTI